MSKELLLGCGFRKQKFLSIGKNKNWNNVIRLDINKDCNPDVVWDLENIPLPFNDNEFDEIHTYEVLEHTGNQGDYLFFFKQFEDFWRILKPNGLLLGSCPNLTSPWLWGDPSHKRVICQESLIFLSQKNYSNTTSSPMTDYRSIYKGDFELVLSKIDTWHYYFGLKCLKNGDLNV